MAYETIVLQGESEPLGAIVLRQYTVSKAGRDVKREHAFKITKGGAKSYIFAAESHQDMERYVAIIREIRLIPNTIVIQVG